MTKILTAENLSLLGTPAVFTSKEMLDLLARVERVGQTNATVLITGESGSGKELIARALHQFSLRCTKAWVDVNCAALPDHLVESELFGYEKGAFSGADNSKPGLFELAHSGTIFLDEIGELEPRTQVKLLRVLDGVPYYRLGAQRKVSVDVRIVAATNQDLQQAIDAGKFRRDLFHRLNQVHIHVPPLRQRKDDIEPLARFFLSQLSPRATLTPEAVEALQRYSWPGNVRELRNAVIKAAVQSGSFHVALADLPSEVRNPSATVDATSTYRLDALEKQMILKVLSETGGRHQRAAELLGISRRTLTRKLRTYGMESATVA